MKRIIERKSVTGKILFKETVYEYEDLTGNQQERQLKGLMKASRHLNKKTAEEIARNGLYNKNGEWVGNKPFEEWVY